MKQKFICKSLQELDLIAGSLLKYYPKSKIFAFYGKMGVGKTTFINSICKKLEILNTVNSPTFSIINEYKCSNNSIIYHLDFYRIKKLEEIFDIGYEDYFFSNSYCFIEWPEKVENLLPNDSVRVTIEEDKNCSNRIISF